ncbi:MAG: hypothetical protein DMD69_02995 [Gemmatimonadetes bacterium]|nr:MAG: hypothetical protein DMD69_02995 [Gemmatimonadota bacterium]
MSHAPPDGRPPPSAGGITINVTGITGEMVVGGEARTLTLTGLSLASGGQYQAVVFAFSKYVQTPGDMDGQFNVSTHSVTFQAP